MGRKEKIGRETEHERKVKISERRERKRKEGKRYDGEEKGKFLRLKSKTEVKKKIVKKKQKKIRRERRR